jgi:hypothetical protein
VDNYGKTAKDYLLNWRGTQETVSKLEALVITLQAEKAALVEAGRKVVASKGEITVETPNPVNHMYLTVGWVAFSDLENLLPPLSTTPEGQL